MTDPFASVAQYYDIMVDWPTRLARERPFFERVFHEHATKRVLDVGCGTGHHSRLFAELGADVTGIDPSTPMIEWARALTTSANPRFQFGGFADIPNLSDRYDLIAVLGNTLAYARDADDLANILTNMRKALMPAGRLCLQVVNYDAILAEGARWLPLIHRSVDGHEYLFLREYRLMGAFVEFTIITLTRDGEWTRQVERSQHYPITGDALRDALQRAGFVDYAFFGSFKGEPYAPQTASTLLALATANGG